MRSADGIPHGPAPVAPDLRVPNEALRAAAGPEREVIDDSIVRTVDQIEYIAREASRPLDFWAKLALDNARHPPAHPVPYWSALDHTNRQADAAHRSSIEHPDEARRRLRDRESCTCENTERPSYSAPRLGEAPPQHDSKNPVQRNVTKTMIQRYAATGRLVDMLV